MEGSLELGFSKYGADLSVYPYKLPLAYPVDPGRREVRGRMISNGVVVHRFSLRERPDAWVGARFWKIFFLDEL